MRIFSKITLFFTLMFVTGIAYGALSISISGSPGTLTISTATAGQQPAAVTNTSTTYSITTVGTVTTITGKINANMPTGTTLSVNLKAPTGATSTGSVAMSTTAANLVTAIPKSTTGSSLTITYTFTATTAAAQVTGATKTLTLTIQ